jgi:flagellar basal-body rod protein FlgG
MEDGARILPQITLPLNAQNLYISRNGAIQAQVNGQQLQQLGTIQVARFTNPEGLQMIGNNRYVATVASGPAQVAQAGTQGYAEVVSGAIERSNVDLGAEMVTMIGIQRAYSLALRMLQTTDRMHALAVELRA